MGCMRALPGLATRRSDDEKLLSASAPAFAICASWAEVTPDTSIPGVAPPADAYSTSPSATSAEHPVAPIDADGLAGDIGRVVREKEHDGARDLLGQAEPTERDRVEQAPLPGRPHGFPLPLGGRIRADEARRHAVHADAMGAQLARGLASEADEARFRAGIGLDTREAVGASRSR